MIEVRRSGSKSRIRFANFAPKIVICYYHIHLYLYVLLFLTLLVCTDLENTVQLFVVAMYLNNYV